MHVLNFSYPTPTMYDLAVTEILKYYLTNTELMLLVGNELIPKKQREEAAWRVLATNNSTNYDLFSIQLYGLGNVSAVAEQILTLRGFLEHEKRVEKLKLIMKGTK